MTVGEGGIRSPLIIAGPGVNKGVQSNAFSCVWDLMSTILDIANIEHPQRYNGIEVEKMRGRSLKEVLAGSKRSVYEDDALVGGEMINGKWMRQGNFKAISVASPYGDAQWRLYDVVLDPGESENLSEKHPLLLEKLRSAWDEYALKVGVILTH